MTGNSLYVFQPCGPNGLDANGLDARQGKFLTCVELAFGLALRGLATNCSDLTLIWAPIRTQVDACFSRFVHQAQSSYASFALTCVDSVRVRLARALVTLMSLNCPLVKMASVLLLLTYTTETWRVAFLVLLHFSSFILVAIFEAGSLFKGKPV